MLEKEDDLRVSRVLFIFIIIKQKIKNKQTNYKTCLSVRVKLGSQV
jgi:hypothetical protein